VADLWVDNENGGEWGFSWRHRFFIWETNIREELMADLHGYRREEAEDGWRWRSLTWASSISNLYHNYLYLIFNILIIYTMNIYILIVLKPRTLLSKKKSSACVYARARVLVV